MESRFVLKLLLPNKTNSFLDIFEDRIVGKYQSEKHRNQEINETKASVLLKNKKNLKILKLFYRNSGNTELVTLHLQKGFAEGGKSGCKLRHCHNNVCETLL